MKTWLKILIVLAVVGIIGAFLIWKFLYNKPHTDYSKEKADIEITANILFDNYLSNPDSSNQKFLDKVILVKGKISKIESTDSSNVIVFVFRQGDFGDEGIRCVLLPDEKVIMADFKPEQDISIKGHCTGYNGTDISLDKCTIVKD